MPSSRLSAGAVDYWVDGSRRDVSLEEFYSMGTELGRQVYYRTRTLLWWWCTLVLPKSKTKNNLSCHFHLNAFCKSLILYSLYSFNTGFLLCS